MAVGVVGRLCTRIIADRKLSTTERCGQWLARARLVDLRAVRRRIVSHRPVAALPETTMPTPLSARSLLLPVLSTILLPGCTALLDEHDIDARSYSTETSGGPGATSVVESGDSDEPGDTDGEPCDDELPDAFCIDSGYPYGGCEPPLPYPPPPNSPPPNPFIAAPPTPRSLDAVRDSVKAAALSFDECETFTTHESVLACLKKLPNDASVFHLLKAMKVKSNCLDLRNVLKESKSAQPADEKRPRLIFRCAFTGNHWLAIGTRSDSLEYLQCNNPGVGKCDFGQPGDFKGAAYKPRSLPATAADAISDGQTGAHGSPQCDTCHIPDNEDNLKLPLNSVRGAFEMTSAFVDDFQLKQIDCNKQGIDAYELTICVLRGTI
jgi:hypothetical protein